MFEYPKSIIKDVKKPEQLIVADTGNKALRSVDVKTRVVSTLIKSDFSFAGNSQDEQSGDVFIISNQILRYIYQNKMVQHLTGSNMAGYWDGALPQCFFNGIGDIITLDQTTHLLADQGNDRIRLVEREKNATSTLVFQFEGCASEPTELPFQSCQALSSSTYSILKVNRTLFIGYNQGILSSKSFWVVE